MGIALNEKTNLYKNYNSTITLPLPDKENNWHNAADFTRIMKREIARSYRSGSPLTYLIFDFSEYIELKINYFNTKKTKFERFFLMLIEIINQNTREFDVKCVKSMAQIDLLLVDTNKDGAANYMNKMKKILSNQLNLPRMKNFREVIKSIKISYYPLNQLTGKSEIHINSSLKSQMEKEKKVSSVIKNYTLKFEPTATNIFPPAMAIAGDALVFDYPISWSDTVSEKISRFIFNTAKRLVDISGALVGITLFGPIMIIIALAVKFTSPGPILFKQKRVGYLGMEFTFLKFRSMRTDMDDSIHREFMKKVIDGKNDEINMGTEDKPVYKMVNDPRITKIGAFIRKTSLDELPQFFNVLFGDMSLVGPRPPIPYEVDLYKNWHLKRISEVKPGITGLWQASGRSETTFDEMVRLDIQYVNNQSVWLDIKILLKTIPAVLRSEGAY